VITRKILDILYLDGMAGLFSGLILFSFQSWFNGIYSLPHYILTLIITANMLYGALALLLAIKIKRNLLAIKVLAIANSAWVATCICLIFTYIHSVSWAGISLLVLEATFVGYLAYYEWINSTNLIFRPAYK